MIEIRFHGRGGQGAVIASKLLAEAAFREGKEVSAFPYFGVERRGAPVTAFTRIDEKPIRIKSQIYEPDYVIVMDPSLLKAVDVSAGLKDGGIVLINSSRTIEKLREDVPKGKIAVVDATEIAIQHRLGSRNAPIVNSAILGAFAKASGLVKIDSVVDSIMANAPSKKEENAAAAKDAYDKVGGE
ncbi:MAG: pyruvate ferredoxin oxidoreductase subunit gamma [Candidatus Thermoplasmatota archaeon]|nr:pyruvate ferredoxin oxidoreductase subunit gamma [Candidatus Thermoplasmatota archaeon]